MYFSSMISWICASRNSSCKSGIVGHLPPRLEITPGSSRALLNSPMIRTKGVEGEIHARLGDRRAMQ